MEERRSWHVIVQKSLSSRPDTLSTVTSKEYRLPGSSTLEAEEVLAATKELLSGLTRTAHEPSCCPVCLEKIRIVETSRIFLAKGARGKVAVPMKVRAGGEGW